MEPESTKLCSQEAHNWLVPRTSLIHVSGFGKITDATKLPSNWVLSKALSNLFIVLPSCYLLLVYHTLHIPKQRTDIMHKWNALFLILTQKLDFPILYFTLKALSGESRKLHNSVLHNLYSSSSIYYTAVKCSYTGLDMFWCNKKSLQNFIEETCCKVSRKREVLKGCSYGQLTTNAISYAWLK